MPLYEYAAHDGRRVEEVFLRSADAPKTIRRDGVTFTRVLSAPSFRFRGAFSGGTAEHHLKHDQELATPHEIRKHAARQKQYREEQQDRDRKKHIEESLRDLAI